MAVKLILRSVVAIGSVVALASCSGENNADDVIRETSAYVNIQPDPASAVQGSSVIVRVDVARADGQAPAAYEIDFDELQSRVKITTAPCPASLGRPACQDWTIEPAANSVPGHYPIRVRTVGLSVGVARGSFLLHVIDGETRRFGAAVDAALGGPTTFLLTSDGRIVGRGHNTAAAVGRGYLQQKFNDMGPPGFNDLLVYPTYIPRLVPVLAGAEPEPNFVSVAATEYVSFALGADGRVWRWGSERPGASPRPAGSFQLSPTPIPLSPTPVPRSEEIVSMSAYQVHQSEAAAVLAVRADGRVWFWHDNASSTDPRVGGTPELVRAAANSDEPLQNVRSVNGALMLLNDGRVFSAARSLFDATRGYVPELPRNIIQLAFAEMTTSSTPRYRSAAVDAGGGLWIWDDFFLAAPGVPNRYEAFADVVAVALDHRGFLYVLRRDSDAVWVVSDPARPVLGETIHEISPPRGQRFVRVAPGYGITNDCGEDSGTPWRIYDLPDFDTTRDFRVTAESGFGVGGFDCPLDQDDTSSVTVQVEGQGRVVIEPGGLECTGSCEGRFRNGSEVFLTPVPAVGWRFLGWQSDICGRKGDPAYSYIIDPATVRSCTAVFELAPPAEHRLTVHSTGGGIVVSDPEGIICGGLCSRWFATGRTVTLTAQTNRGYRFEGFAGDEDCADGSLTMDAGRVCSATFVALPPPLAPEGLIATPGRTTVRLEWFAVEEDISGYRVERAREDGVFVEVSGLLLPADTQFIDQGLEPGTQYTYRVRALGPVSAGRPAEVVVITLVADLPPPPPPPPPPPGGMWSQFGASFSGTVAQPALALGAGQAPVVAYLDRDAGGVDRLRVRRHGGGLWFDLGALNPAPALQAFDPAIVADPSGRLVVAWIQIEPDLQHLQVARYNGSTWDRLCGEPTTCALNFGLSVPAERPSIALDVTGNPIVAWIENGSIAVKRFDGGTWQPLAAGRGPIAAGVPTRVKITLGPTSAPHVAWITMAADTFVGVARADSGAWTHLGSTLGSEPGAGTSVFDVDLAFGTSGEPVVAWVRSGIAGARAHVRQWNGAEWLTLGEFAASTSASAEGFAFRISVDGTPYVALSSFSLAGVGRLEVVRRIGGAWQLYTSFDARIGPLSMALPNTDATSSPHLTWIRGGAVETWRWIP